LKKLREKEKRRELNLNDAPKEVEED